MAQALETIDYPRVIEQLYRDGARIFIEVGPGGSCSRMINSILEGRPHIARSICLPGQDATTQVLRLFGQCLAEGIAVDLEKLYGSGALFQPRSGTQKPIVATIGGTFFKPSLPDINSFKTAISIDEVKVDNKVTGKAEQSSSTVENRIVDDAGIGSINRHIESHFKAHEAYLNFSSDMQQALTAAINQQMNLLQQVMASGENVGSVDSFNPSASVSVTDVPRQPAGFPAAAEKVAFDRDLCMEFAIGSVGNMLGPDFAEVDTYPTRVRLPDEPLMLVDRILTVEGEPRSMSHGRVVTEHDVHPQRWYLDGGRIPTCVAVEAGQADLFLSAYLGIDFISKARLFIVCLMLRSLFIARYRWRENDSLRYQD